MKSQTRIKLSLAFSFDLKTLYQEITYQTQSQI